MKHRIVIELLIKLHIKTQIDVVRLSGAGILILKLLLIMLS